MIAVMAAITSDEGFVGVKAQGRKLSYLLPAISFWALPMFCEGGDLPGIQRLFQQDSSVLRGVTFQGYTALHIAAREGHENIVKWILGEKRPEVRNNDDNTPLHEAPRNRAAASNNFRETAIVIDYGREQTVKESNDTTGTHQGQATYEEGATSCLLAAVHGGKLEIVVAILNHRAHDRAWHNDLMTQKDKFGRCAVHVAAMKGRWDIINEFMSERPDCVEIRSSDHKSVLHFAVEYNQLDVVQNLLADKNAEKKVQLVGRDHDLFHNTALHLAAKKGVNPQLLKCLLSPPGVDMNALNLDVNALNDEGMTALDIALAAAPDDLPCAIIVEILEGAGARKRKSKQGLDKDIVSTHVLVASLIATVTFAAILTIPGGIEEDDSRSIHYGAARMAFRKVFRLFLFSDTAAFTSCLTVVTAWLVRELFPDTYLLRQKIVSHMSGVTLLVSIAWTIVAFVCATIIVTIPGNFEKLGSMDEKALSHYKFIRRDEILLAITPPLYVGFPLLISLFGERGKSLYVSLNRVDDSSIRVCHHYRHNTW